MTRSNRDVSLGNKPLATPGVALTIPALFARQFRLAKGSLN